MQPLQRENSYEKKGPCVILVDREVDMKLCDEGIVFVHSDAIKDLEDDKYLFEQKHVF